MGEQHGVESPPTAKNRGCSGAFMRYLKATILIATISAALTIILFAAGWISTTPDLVLREKVYQMPKPFIIPDGAP
jgi:hypothetical protein